MPDNLPGTGAANEETPDFADLLSITKAISSDSGTSILKMGEASAKRNDGESDLVDGERCVDTPNFDGFAYLFMMQATPNQVAMEAATDKRYSLRPELVEAPEGTMEGAAASGADELRSGSSVVEQPGALVQRSTPDLNFNEVHQPADDLLDRSDHVREFHAQGTAEELNPATTDHTLIGKESDTRMAPNEKEADEARTEFQARAEPPNISPEPNADPSAGLQAFHVRLSKPTQESSPTRERSRDSPLQKAGADSTPIHGQSINTTGASDESTAFTDAVSATKWVEPDVQQLTPLRQVSVAFESADGPIHLRVHDRAGEMRAWVSTSTEQIAHTLQKGLGELTQSLNAAGFEAEVSWPTTAGAALAQDVQSDTSQSDGNSQQSAHQDRQDRGADERGSGRERRSSEGEDFGSFLR
jgi:hypothetical protein